MMGENQVAGVDSEAPVGAIQAVTVDGSPYALIRHAFGWSLLPDACSHAGCAFTANGEVADDTVLICNCHGAEFDVQSGEVLLGPAHDPLRACPVEVRDGVLHLPSTLRAQEEAEPAPGQAESVASVVLQADLEKCKGYANCVVAAEDYLDLDDDGVVVLLRTDVRAEDRSRVEEAVRSCPISALTLESK